MSPMFDRPEPRRDEDDYQPSLHPSLPCSDMPPLDDTSKATNPKDAIGSSKLPLHLWPKTATAMGCLGLLEGMLKYGRSNWREAGVRASIYYDALERHIGAWFEGEDFDPDSGMPHLSHALACLAIVVDAQAAGKLVDDRQYHGEGYRQLVEELTPHVERAKAHHAHREPRHYTIEDGRDLVSNVVERVGEYTPPEPDFDAERRGWE